MGKGKEQNHYKTLGVDKDADTAEIKHAYRNAAMKHHPDAATGDSDAFRSVQEAYEVLRDKEQRSAYDRNREKAGLQMDVRRSSGRQDPPVRTQEYERPGRTSYFPGHSLIDELAIDLILSPAEAIRGCRVPLTIPARVRCPECGGRGCAACSGFGEAEIEKNISIEIPAGVQNGVEAYFTLDGAGLPGSALHVTVVIDGW
ncbi:MAG: DnaJ domain-containing protein [Spirochaetales bacterium]|nr:DnaJ domain-containing protein [Spirochaetales bacterium]